MSFRRTARVGQPFMKTDEHASGRESSADTGETVRMPTNIPHAVVCTPLIFMH